MKNMKNGDKVTSKNKWILRRASRFDWINDQFQEQNMDT